MLFRSRMSYTFYKNTGDPVDPVDLSLAAYDAEVYMTIPITFTKELPVSLSFVDGGGITKDNIECEFSHNTITVSGDAEELEKLQSLVLGTVDLAALTGDQTKAYPLPIPEDVVNETGVNEIEVSIRIVGVATRVLPVDESRMFFVGEQPEGFQLNRITRSMDIMIRGPSEEIGRITQADIRVALAIGGIPLIAGMQSVEPGIYIDGYPQSGVVNRGDTVMIELVPAGAVI